MKIILLKLTSFALVATSTIGAEVPSLRGSDVMVAVEVSCEDGFKAGQKEVKRTWENGGRDCDNALGLSGQMKRTKNSKYPDSGNWRTKSYNECARDGVDAQVKKIQKKCLEDSSAVCTDLGKAAAAHVVKDNFCTPAGATARKRTNYKKQCKEAADAICQGQISTVIDKWCPKQKLRNSVRRDMQSKCRRQINSMVPRDQFGESFERVAEDSINFDDVGDSTANPSASEDSIDFNEIDDSHSSSGTSKDVDIFNQVS